MILKSAVLANFTAGARLRKNMPVTAIVSHVAICIIVKLVTTGLGTRIINVAITPKESPNARLEARTMLL